VKSKRLYIKARRWLCENVEPISRDQWVIFLSFFITGVGIGMGA
jgi:hypothetical protein